MMDSDLGKIFVGGISWECNEDTLKDYFGKYGEVAETVIMRDRITGKARGFGFVLFSDPSVVDQALQDTHIILERTVEVKRAIPRGEQHQNQQNQQHQPYQQNNRGFTKNSSNGGGGNNNHVKTKKIFVGGLPANLTKEEFQGYFDKFGKITDVVVIYDGVTHRPRGFGFITFDSEEAVENVMQNNFHKLNDKLVEVKRAVPKDAYAHGNNGNSNIVGRGSPFYPGPNPRGMYPPFPPPLLWGNPYMGNPYPIRAYNGYGFGAPRSPWNGYGRQSPLPYGNAPFYPNYTNGIGNSFVGMENGGTIPRIDGGKLDAIDSGKSDQHSSSQSGFRPFQSKLVGNSS